MAAQGSRAGLSAIAAAHWPPPLPHLIVGVCEEVIEALDPNEAETWIFHIGHDVERDGQRSCKQQQVHLAWPSARSHPESGEQRATKTKAKEHEVDHVWRVFLGGPCAQTRDFEQTVQGGQRQSAGRAVVWLRASRHRRVP